MVNHLQLHIVRYKGIKKFPDGIRKLRDNKTNFFPNNQLFCLAFFLYDSWIIMLTFILKYTSC